jgi:HAD superfamily hydrolase (TIGR01549 family)
MVWDLTSGDAAASERAMTTLAARSTERHTGRDGIELRAGIPGLLQVLHHDGLLLGLAANQPIRALEDLDRLGIGQLFSHRQMSGHHGFRKPDVRLFLRACEDLGVNPAECIMVGDRIDNDIAPAKWLGMRAVLLRTGRHINQQPRSWHELPDAEVADVPGLEAAISSILST